MDQPIVSVIIPTYNRKDEILKAIQSVVDQKIDNVEIIVVDDGSTDGTSDYLKSLNLPIKIVEKLNGGVSSARNAGIEESKGRYVAFLDSDDLWLEGKLKAQLGYFEQHPEASVVYTDQYINIDGENLEQTRFDRQAPKNKLLLSAFVDFTPIHISTVMVKREVFDTIGKFDERLSVHEDSEFWNRVSDSYNLDFIEKPLGAYCWESGAEHLMSAKNRRKFIDNGRLYMQIYRENKKRPLTTEEKDACNESEKIMDDMEKELNQK